MSTHCYNVVRLLPAVALLLSATGLSSPVKAQSAATGVCTITSAVGATLGQAAAQFSQQCPGRVRNDCDPVGDRWQCSTARIEAGVEQTPIQTSTPAVNPVSTSTAELLIIEAERASQSLGQGWSTEQARSGYAGSGYIVWRGANDFRTSNDQPPAGIKAYDFQVKIAGTYQFIARVQARIGNGSAANDKDNDAWVRFTSGQATPGIRGNAAKWTKFFVSGADESWKNYSSGEQYDPTFFTKVQRDLPAGTHRVLIGGRSARFAIDNVGLRLIKSASGQTPSVSEPVNTAAPAPAVLVANSSNQACTARGDTLGSAAAAYSANCPTIARRDCDKMANGTWLCGSQNITSSTVVQAPAAATLAANPVTVASGDCTASGATLGIARSNYANNCATKPRKDCDPITSGGWLCSSSKLGASAPTTPVAIAPLAITQNESTPPAGNVGVGRLGSNDLLALHYDNCPDRDDGHAIVAGKAIVDTYGLRNPVVVNGTCGAKNVRAYQPESEKILRAVWGSDWLDGFNDQSSAIKASADRWAATLANDDNVWVAEGGPSDFTAEVLKYLGQVYPSVDRKRVRVIQHSAGTSFNENWTLPENIQLVKQVADYRPIPNGNRGDNGSADLNTLSVYFVNTARQSRYASEWAAAFDYLNPNERLDFSDSVEILYIVDDKSTLTVDDFANRYLK